MSSTASPLVGLVHVEGGAFGVSFPDLPGCITASPSRVGLEAEAAEALALHLSGMVADGDTLPAFRSVAAITADPEFADDVATAHEVLLLPVPDLTA